MCAGLLRSKYAEGGAPLVVVCVADRFAGPSRKVSADTDALRRSGRYPFVQIFIVESTAFPEACWALG